MENARLSQTMKSQNNSSNLFVSQISFWDRLKREYQKLNSKFPLENQPVTDDYACELIAHRGIYGGLHC